MASALALALVLLQVAQPMVPFCGSRDKDIGKGFSLTQYMFDGAPNFSLAYQPEADSVKTVGLQATSEFRLLFSDIHLADQTGALGPRSGAHVGFDGYRFVRPDGFAMGVDNLKLECGGDTVLARAYPHADPSRAGDAVPINFALPFFNQPEQRCIRELREDGSFRFTAADDPEATLSVIIEDRLDLDWAVAEAERIWRAEIDRSRDGLCSLMPSPPPPF